MSKPLFKTDCPSCGAPVHVHSATAVTLVCGYCNSLLVRHDDSLTDTGRDSALLEDFSPLQIGTTGSFNQRHFALIGRLQARYDVGVWNEWYAQFDDGSTGWLAEAGDLYVFTLPAAERPDNIPPITDVVPGYSDLHYRDRRFIASDVRSITLSRAGAQGELPFELPEQMNNQVADWRCEQLFMTTDYGSNPPEVFVGRGVTLAELQLGHTRSDAQITDTAGKLKGTRRAENCPNCGSPVEWVTGFTPTVICHSCGSDLDTSSGNAELLKANAMRVAQQSAFSLPLGAQAKINGKTYTLIGAVRKEELEPQEAFDAVFRKPVNAVAVGSWTEYLLFQPQSGFLWLVESEGEWSVSETLNEWPRLTNSSIHPQGSPKLYDYGGRVAFAAGAFYWHIQSGDLNYYTDYRQGRGKLCAERTRFEMAWSKSTPVSYTQIRQWFGLQSAAEVPKYTAKMSPDKATPGLAWALIGIFALLNLPAWVTMPGDSWITSLVTSGMVMWFLFSRGNFASRDDEDDDT